MSNIIPAQVGKQLDVLRHWEDGAMLLGSSSLTGRYWNGSIWLFEESENAPDVEKCSTGYELEAGVVDAQVVKQSRVLVALDSGMVELLEVARDPIVSNQLMFTSVAYGCEHDDTVQSVSISSCSTKAVSGSWDRSIKVWDLETIAVGASNTYREAHSDSIWSVACHPKETDIFASCSQDGTLRLWDTRLARPASQIGEHAVTHIPTSVTWKPDETNIVAIGDETGRILVLDARQEFSSVKIIPAHSRPVTRLAFAHHTPNLLASCADETKVAVSNVSAIVPAVIYEDNSHNDFVRGISWHPITYKLYSCGFDTRVHSHTVNGSIMETSD